MSFLLVAPPFFLVLLSCLVVVFALLSVVSCCAGRSRRAAARVPAAPPRLARTPGSLLRARSPRRGRPLRSPSGAVFLCRACLVSLGLQVCRLFFIPPAVSAAFASYFDASVPALSSFCLGLQCDPFVLCVRWVRKVAPPSRGWLGDRARPLADVDLSSWTSRTLRPGSNCTTCILYL